MTISASNIISTCRGLGHSTVRTASKPAFRSSSFYQTDVHTYRDRASASRDSEFVSLMGVGQLSWIGADTSIKFNCS